MRAIHRSPVNSPHKGRWSGALIFSLICVWINGWVNSREVGDLRRYRAHYDVTVMIMTHRLRGIQNTSVLLNGLTEANCNNSSTEWYFTRSHYVIINAWGVWYGRFLVISWDFLYNNHTYIYTNIGDNWYLISSTNSRTTYQLIFIVQRFNRISRKLN